MFEKFFDDEEGNLIARDGATGTSASGGHFSNLWLSAQKRAGRSKTRVKDRFQRGRGVTGLLSLDSAGLDSRLGMRGRRQEELELDPVSLKDRQQRSEPSVKHSKGCGC